MIESITSNIRAQQSGTTWSRKLARINVIKGPPQSGKTAVAQAAEMLVRGAASGAFGRDVKAEHVLKLLTPDGKKPLVAATFNGKLVSYPSSDNLGRVTSVEVMEALLKNKAGATEFFAALMPRAFDGWAVKLSHDTSTRLDKKGLLDQPIEAVLTALTASLKEAAVTLKQAELLAKQLEMPIPPCRPDLIRASLQALDIRIAKETAALDAEMQQDPSDRNLQQWLAGYDTLCGEVEVREAKMIELDAELVILQANEPPVPEAADDVAAWQALAVGLVAFADGSYPACPLCGQEGVDVKAEHQKIHDWLVSMQASMQARRTWEAKEAANKDAYNRLNAEREELQARVEKGAATLAKHWGSVAAARDKASDLLSLHERLRKRMNERAQLERERQELVSQDAQQKAYAEQALRRTNAVNGAATARQAAASLEAIRDEVVKVRDDMFQDVKRELAAKASYLMGIEHGQPFILEFIEKPIFAPMLRRNGRLEEPSGFTTIRVIVALAALMAGNEYALVLPEDRQSTVEVMTEWLDCLARRLPSNVQVIVQTTLDIPANDCWSLVAPVCQQS